MAFNRKIFGKVRIPSQIHTETPVALSQSTEQSNSGIWGVTEVYGAAKDGQWGGMPLPPVWSTASGLIGSDYTERASSFSVSASVSGGTVTYSLASGALPTGHSLNASTGVISGTASGVADWNSATYDFTIRATTNLGASADRTFSIKITSRKVGYVCGTAGEGGTVSLTAPSGMKFIRRDFSSYGTPNGSCGAFTIGSCNSGSSNGWNPIGGTTASAPATNTQWGDPCVGTSKRMYVQLTYGPF